MEHAASTFCYGRDYAHRDEWLGGELMALAARKPSGRCVQPVDRDQEPSIAATEILVPVPRPVPRLPYDYDERHARNSGKPMTLRSWRDPRSIGGSFGKGALRKLELRLQIA